MLLSAELCAGTEPRRALNANMKHVIGAKVPVRTKPKLKAAGHQARAPICFYERHSIWNRFVDRVVFCILH